MPPPSMSSNSVDPSPSPSSISGGTQNPLVPRSVKILSNTDNSLLVARWASSKLMRRFCERFRYWWSRGMEPSSKWAQKPLSEYWTDMLEEDHEESVMLLTWDRSEEMPLVTPFNLSLLMSLSKFWCKRVAKCPSWSCKFSLPSNLVCKRRC